MDSIIYNCECGLRFKKKHYFSAHKLQSSELCSKINANEKQNLFLKKYIHKSFNNIEYINGVPKVVFVCWFGVTGNEFPIMSINRFNAFKSLVQTIEVPVILLTFENYKYFIKKEYPIHECFKYLSGVHKSDYIRCYMLLHHGGGYHDIKYRKEGWNNCWNEDNWLFNDNIWMFGRREKYKGAIGYPPGMKYIQNEYSKLVTMCWIICKANSLFLKDLVNAIEEKLDCYKDTLFKHPAILPEGYYADKPFDLVPNNSYPIRWLEILGEIFHPLMLKYNDHIKFGLLDAFKKNYK